MSASANSTIDALASMQQWMFDALVLPQHVDQEKIDQQLLASPTQNAAARLSIYQRSYILRLCKCLEEQFPALCYALGKPLFNDFAQEYLRQYPSNSYTLYELGHRFTLYLKQNRPDKDLPVKERETWIDFMLDLASYEYELFRLFDAQGHEGKAWPDASTSDDHLVLQPCFSIAQYRFPVAAYYHQVRDKKQPSLPPQQASYIAISRKDYMTASYPVIYTHYLFLTALHTSGKVQVAIEHVANTLQRSVDEVTQSWQHDVRQIWINSGFFIDKRVIAAATQSRNLE